MITNKYLNSLNHQLSIDSLRLLEEYGIFDISEVCPYIDYNNSNKYRYELYNCTPNIIVNVQENNTNHHQIVIICNIKTKCVMAIYKTNRGKVVKKENLADTTDSIIDLTYDGDRWEGDSLDGFPCGWGRYYDVNNALSYEGFRYKNNMVCYGTIYYADLDNYCKQYEGMFCFNMRYGIGKEYDRKGMLHYNSYWLNNNKVSANTIVVPRCTETTLYHNVLMSNFTINEMSYASYQQFTLINYLFLKTLEIGERCFSLTTKNQPIPNPYSQCIIERCNVLESISIDSYSFWLYDTIAIKNLPKLKELRFGKNTNSRGVGFWVNSLKLYNLPELQSIEICKESFCNQHYTEFQDLPKLRYIKLGNNALCGNSENLHFLEVNSNQFIMKNLPSLSSFVGASANCCNYGDVTLENIPLLKSQFISFLTPIFENAQVHIQNAPGFSNYFYFVF